ncbi:hypothetical protein ACHQM5_023609 [Ranunculus cassubicifolius]
MNTTKNLSSLNCELRIIRAKNVDFLPIGSLFVRYYLRTADDRRVRLSTQEIPSTCDPRWNETITLECLGTEDAMDKLKQQSVVFELRWRKQSGVFGKFGGSKLLFRAEIGWNDVLDSSKRSMEKWITTATTSKYVPEGQKSPALQIGMKIQDAEMVEMPKSCHLRSKWNECGCSHGDCKCNGRDDDIFLLAEALYLS